MDSHKKEVIELLDLAIALTEMGIRLPTRANFERLAHLLQRVRKQLAEEES